MRIIKSLPIIVLLASAFLIDHYYAIDYIHDFDLSKRLELGAFELSVSYNSLLLNGFYFGVLLPCVLLIEIGYAGYQHSSLHSFIIKRDRSSGLDLLFFFFYLVRISKLLTLIYTFGIIYLFDKYLPLIYDREHSFFAYFALADNVYLAFFLYLLVWSFTDYWNHRLLHFKVLWPIHRLHHSSSNLTIFTAFRNHPTVAILTPVTEILPLMLLGVPGTMVILIVYLNSAYQLLAHSAIQSTWGWFGKWILISPAHHRLHHSAESKHFKKNLGVIAIWDHLFGTYMDVVEPIRVGVDMDRYEKNGVFRIFYLDLLESISLMKESIFRPTR